MLFDALSIKVIKNLAKPIEMYFVGLLRSFTEQNEKKSSQRSKLRIKSLKIF